ncbi:MAG: PDZ domain-containing protein [Planctomycetes bacterium]|nr:PDZ domain-containing protein [Planctomycetota bacterium]
MRVAESGAEPTAADIRRWIEELDADQFAVRRVATDKLILAGKSVVRAVAEAACGSNLEVTARGTYVLRELALSDDEATQDCAMLALQQLADSQVKAAARLASEAMRAMGAARQQRAVEHLQGLGAKIDVMENVFGFQQFTMISVEIDAAFAGVPDDLRRLTWMKDIHQVVYVGDRITDEWLEPLRHLENLARLTIRHANITDEALQTIRNLDRLTDIALLYTPVTDVCLEQLRGLKSARLIRLYGTQVTEQGVRSFLASAQDVQVDFKRGGFLGVQCQQRVWPCEVVLVTPDSAAERAGIRVRDVIVSHEGQRIFDFEELRALIAQYKPGDTVGLQIARGGSAVTGGLIRDRGQALGVEGETVPYGCRITKVHPDGAGAKNGLHVGDVVVQMDQKRIDTFQQLQQIYTLTADQELTQIALLREAEILSVRVTFGEWKE